MDQIAYNGKSNNYHSKCREDCFLAINILHDVHYLTIIMILYCVEHYIIHENYTQAHTPHIYIHVCVDKTSHSKMCNFPLFIHLVIRRYIMWESEWWHRNCDMYMVHFEYNKYNKHRKVINELSCAYIHM